MDITAFFPRRQAQRSSSVFSSLPWDVLSVIAQQLQFKDRLAFFSCCPATRAYQKAATGEVWPQLEFVLESPAQVGKLAAWLASNMQHLGSLTLNSKPPSAASAAAAQGQAVKDATELAPHAMLLLGGLAGGTVHSLCLTARGEAHLGGWLGMLPRLQRLTAKAGQLVVGADLSALKSLTCLDLSMDWTSQVFSFITFPEGVALPPPLKRLQLSRFDISSAAAALKVSPLLELREVLLMSPSSSGPGELWDALASLPQLSSLTLSAWGLLDLPWKLAALTGLQELIIQRNDLGEFEDALQPVAALEQLTKLSLQGNCLRTVPPCIISLPALQDLNLGENFINASLPLASSSLTRLDLDDNVVLASLGQLTGLPALRTLCIIVPEWSETDLAYDGRNVGRIIKALNKLPNFELLDTEDVYGEPSAFSVAGDVLDELGMLRFRIVSCP